jgi:alpha-tubulin suppressor-like RCC1 family protein
MRTALWLTLMMLAALALPVANAAPVALSDVLDCGEGDFRVDGDLTCSLDLSEYQDLSRLRVELVGSDEVRPTGGPMLAVGSSMSCAVLDNGSLMCWGSDGHGQLGDGGQMANQVRPTNLVVLPEGRHVMEIHAVRTHVCALLDDGAVWCWGYGSNGELGDGTTNTYSSPTNAVILPAGRTAVSIGLGGYHACAILDDASMVCWGLDNHGQGGNGQDDNDPRATPVTVAFPQGREPVQVDGGEAHTCALMNDGGVMCWGRDHVGQLGDNGTNANQYEPGSNAMLPDGRRATSISLAGHTSCAVLDDGTLACWGENNYGQLGDNTTTRRNVPTLAHLPENLTVLDVGVNYHNTCVVYANGSMGCWGHDHRGRLANGPDEGNTWLPSVINQSSGFVDVEVGVDHSCAHHEEGIVQCWGRSNWGQSGTGQTYNRLEATPVDFTDAPFASVHGPAPTGWASDGALRALLMNPDNGVWDLNMDLPLGTDAGVYSLHIEAYTIGGQRESYLIEDAIPVLERDRDGDGVGDSEDAFPDDATEQIDSDGDGVGDVADAFPDDANRSAVEEADDGLSADLGSMDTLTIIGAGAALLVLVLVLGMMLGRRGGGDSSPAPKPKKNYAKAERKY